MNGNRKMIGILQIILVLSLGATAMAYVLDDGYAPRGDGRVTVVSSPQQDEAWTPAWAETRTVEAADMGVNLALGKPAGADGFNDVYGPENVTDGNYGTYWEGRVNAYPNVITVDLGDVQNIARIRVALNPDKIWGERVQNFSVSGSTDGEAFKEIAAAQDYPFDPKTGNTAVATLDQAAGVRFVQLRFSKNTGAGAAQIAELEIYAAE